MLHSCTILQPRAAFFFPTAADCKLLCLCSGLHESLHMTVAIPLLWGIPPRHETLRYAKFYLLYAFRNSCMSLKLVWGMQYCHCLWWRHCREGVSPMATVWIEVSVVCTSNHDIILYIPPTVFVTALHDTQTASVKRLYHHQCILPTFLFYLH